MIANESSDVTLASDGAKDLSFDAEPFAVVPPPKAANSASRAAEFTGWKLASGVTGAAIAAAVCTAEDKIAGAVVVVGPATGALLVATAAFEIDASGDEDKAPDVEPDEAGSLVAADGVAAVAGDWASDGADDPEPELIPPPAGAVGSVAGRDVSNAPCTVSKSRPVISPLP